MQPTIHPERGSTFSRVLSYPFRRVWRAFRNLDGGYVRGHPELELFPTEQHRRQAVRRAASKIIGRRPFFASVAAAAGLSLAITLVLRSGMSRFGLPISQTMLNLILMFPVIIPCAFFGNWLLSRYVPELLRYELLDCGVPICVPCGYPLIGLPGPNCPECGRPFDEQGRRILDLDT